MLKILNLRPSKQTSNVAGSSRRGQGLLEFAMILPLLLLFFMGIVEAGRLMAILSSVSSAARQSARYGSVGGDSGHGVPYYLDCAGMRQSAKTTSLLQPLSNSDIRISYDRGTLTDTIGLCATTDLTPTLSEGIKDGDRVVISITTTYQPLVPIVPLPPIPMSFVAAHTIFTTIIGPTPTPLPKPDLAISKTGFPAGIIPTGSTALTYTIVVTNNGPLEANNIVVTDTLPANMSTSPITITTGAGWNGCNQAGHVITCTLSFLGSFSGGNVSTPITINVNAPITPPGIIVNTAQVGYGQTDSQPTNNTATASTFIESWVDLELHKTSLVDPVEASGLVSYALTVQNNNWVTEPGSILLTDTLPLNTTFQSFSSTDSSWIKVAQGATWVSFSRNVPIPVGSTAPTLTVVLTAPSPLSLPVSGLITNLATVTSLDMPDPFPDNNTNITATTAIVAEADLALSKTGPTTANALTNYNYILHVTNNGPAPATNFRVTDTVPDLANIIVTQTGAGWSCTTSGNQVGCGYSSLLTRNATTSDITVTVQGTVPGTADNIDLTNTAVVGFVGTIQSDPQPNNNTASATTNVTTCFPGLVNASKSTVTANPSSVDADSTSTSQILVTLEDSCGHVLTAPEYHTQQVTLTSSSGGLDTVTLASGFNNPTSNGQVAFKVGSNSPYTQRTSTYSARAVDTVTGAIVNIANPAQVAFNTNCVAVAYPPNPSPGTALKFTVNNNTGRNRSLTALTLSWSGANIHVQSVLMGVTSPLTQVYNPNGNSNPFTITSGWLNTNARKLNNGANATLEFDFNNGVAGGAFTLATTWDDQNGNYKCNATNVTANP